MRRWLRGLGMTMALLVAVEGAATAPAGRYTVSSGTVYDAATKLTWQRVVTAQNLKAWADAAPYCQGLALNGSGWRVPSVVEMRSLVDRSQTPTIDLTAFPNPATDIPFWTATPVSGSAGLAWTVEFYGGASSGDYLVNADYVRCVR